MDHHLKLLRWTHEEEDDEKEDGCEWLDDYFFLMLKEIFCSKKSSFPK